MSLSVALNTFLGPALVISLILIECFIRFSGDIKVKKTVCTILVIALAFLFLEFFLSLFNLIPDVLIITENLNRTILFFLPVIFTAIMIFFLRKEIKWTYFLFAIGLIIGIITGSNDLLWTVIAAMLLFAYLFIIINDSKIDSLTGLNNRFSFFEFTDRISRNKTGESWLIVMLDVNNFKTINNIYGHQEGDYVLRNLSQIIMKHVRKSDFAARYGGDEFVIATRAENGIHEIISGILDELDNFNEKSGKPYNIEIRYGADTYTSDGSKLFDDFLNNIDQLMKRQLDEARRVGDL